MPHLSKADMVAFLRRRLISSARYVAALLEVRSHAGEVLFRVGGCWDTHLRRYVDRPCEPHVITLQESQLELGRALGSWIEAKKAEKKRRRVLMGGGNRGSGKTWFLGGLAFVALGLAFPGSVQFGVNLAMNQKAECIEAIRAVARPEWIVDDVSDLRNPRTEFLTGSVVEWKSARRPQAIRQAGRRIVYVLINEAQDQGELVFINGVAALRNIGGLMGIATNPPREESGDWVDDVWKGIEEGGLNGERYLLDNRLNRAIDQDAVDDIGAFIRAVNREAAEADVEGVFRLAGNIAYPAFSSKAWERGGHVGRPDLGLKDVTRELTAAAIGGSVGYDYICGVDFQRTPGIIGDLAKLCRDAAGELLMVVLGQVAVRGVEPDFSQALIAAGYAPIHGMTGEDGKPLASVLLIGDATGARQNAEHKFSQPNSFRALQADGWKVLPPMYHWRHRTPWNPLVKDSRAQMHDLLERRRILFAEECRQPVEGFPSLVESFRRSKVGPRGGLVEKGNYQHGPDGVRYLAWRFLPRPRPPAAPPLPESKVSEEIWGLRSLPRAE